MIKDADGTWWTIVYASSDVFVAYDAIKAAGLKVEIVGAKEIKVLADEIGSVMKILARLPHRND
jgi:hypothetical protein